jgi:hypothetical protein
MKRTLFIASIIGLFMATSLDLQAHHKRNGLPQLVRFGIAASLFRSAPLRMHRGNYAQYHDQYGRQSAREIRRNEKRIWKLEKKINRLERHEGNFRKIHKLEQEINWLERRNDFLRNRLY